MSRLIPGLRRFSEIYIPSRKLSLTRRLSCYFTRLAKNRQFRSIIILNGKYAFFFIPPALSASAARAASDRDRDGLACLPGFPVLPQAPEGKSDARRLPPTFIYSNQRSGQRHLRIAVRLVRLAQARFAHGAYRKLGIGATSAGCQNRRRVPDPASRLL